MAKTSVSFAQFFYRVNTDSTIDAICGYCFLTVATANTRTELRLLESAHHCRNSLSTRAELTRLGFGLSRIVIPTGADPDFLLRAAGDVYACGFL